MSHKSFSNKLFINILSIQGRGILLLTPQECSSCTTEALTQSMHSGLRGNIGTLCGHAPSQPGVQGTNIQSVLVLVVRAHTDTRQNTKYTEYLCHSAKYYKSAVPYMTRMLNLDNDNKPDKISIITNCGMSIIVQPHITSIDTITCMSTIV